MRSNEVFLGTLALKEEPKDLKQCFAGQSLAISLHKTNVHLRFEKKIFPEEGNDQLKAFFWQNEGYLKALGP